MKIYSVLFAEDVPHYGPTEIEAANNDDAIDAAKICDVSAITTDPNRTAPFCKRIVNIIAHIGFKNHWSRNITSTYSFRFG